MNEEAEQISSSLWWRWPLLPIAATVGSTLGAVAFGLFQWFAVKMSGIVSTDGWYFLYVSPMFSSAVFGWLFIYISCELAPRGELIVAIVMTTVLSVLSIAMLCFTWLDSHSSAGQSIQVTIGSIVSLVAAVVTVVEMHKKQSSA
ncbi:MAG TPA: hypothetical protein VE029_01405 [Rhizobacter sp.]|nr:hypothetical protein [Rhizobacter sp.]